MHIDHLIYAVRDLDAAAARFDSLGLSSYPGGSHPGLGTSNRIVPLGDAYIELLAPAPFDDRFAGWMLRGLPMPDDALPMERVTPTGEVLRWQLAGLAGGSIWEVRSPVLIEWAEGTTLPGRAVEPVGTLESVTLGPDAAVLAATVRRNDGRPVVLGTDMPK
jgi:hypothetical protein